MKFFSFQLNFAQLRLLLWKGFRIQKRNVLSTALELLVPLVFTLALLPIRSIIKSDYYDDCTKYKQFGLKSFAVDFVQFTNSTFAFYPNTSKFVNKIMDKISDELSFQYKCKHE